jgi:hypothetical protein
MRDHITVRKGTTDQYETLKIVEKRYGVKLELRRRAKLKENSYQ